ncbi:hypothetical protein ACVWYF_004088 [Hymenobacter sp. UYAg731]
MDDFEEKIRALFAKKVPNPSHLLELNEALFPSPKDGLEALLEHVYKEVLIPAHRMLIKQEAFATSTVGYEGDFGDTYDDGMEDRPVVVLKVVWQQTQLFEYWLSFDGDSDGREASLWRKVDIYRAPLDLKNLPAGFFDMDDLSVSDDERFGKPNLAHSTIALVEEYESFHTLDMDEAVRLVQADFYWVCDTLL